MRFRAAFAAALMSLSVIATSPAAADGCDGDPANPACPVLDYAGAAHVYLRYICPANAALRKFDRAVAKYDKRDRIGDKPSSKTRRSARLAAEAQAAVAQAFSDGYTYAGFWPDSIAEDLETIAQGAFANSGILYGIARKGSRWEDSDWAGIADAADRVRYELGLPPRNSC